MAGVAKVRGVFCAESRDWFGGLGILSVYVVLGGSVRSCVGGASQAGPPSPPCDVFTQIFVFHCQLALLS